MIERAVMAQIQRIGNPVLRGWAQSLARLVLDNWFYLLFVVFLLRFPYLVADLTGSDVMPRRPSGDSAFWQSEMARALIMACLAMSYNLLFGFSGIISFGHALFFGAGGYVTFLLLTRYDPALPLHVLTVIVLLGLALAIFSRFSARTLLILLLTAAALVLILLPTRGTISFLQAAGVALVLSLSVSLISSLVTLRLRGIYFAMFTLALAEMFWVLAKSGTFRNYTGAEDGLGFRDVLPEWINPTQTFDGSRLQMYRVTVVFFVLVFLAIRRYLNSPVGRVMLAIRENEERARTIGYDTLYYKLLTMTFAGAIATLSGLLFVVWSTDKRVHPEILSLKYTVDPLLNTLIGGVGTLTGPVIATLGLNLGETYLRNETFTLGTQVLGVLPVWALLAAIISGIVLLAVRRPLRRSGEALRRRVGSQPPPPQESRAYRRFMRGYLLSVWIVVLLLVWIVVGQALAGSATLEQVYHVSDLWELLLGALFVVVVMLLPHGIVGTWNRYWVRRRIRRMERELQQPGGAGSR